MEHHELELDLIIEQILLRADLSLQQCALDIRGQEAGSVEETQAPRRQVSRMYLTQEGLFLHSCHFCPSSRHSLSIYQPIQISLGNMIFKALYLELQQVGRGSTLFC